MQVQAEGSQIPWIGHLKRPCHYGSDKGLWSYRVANPNEGQGGPVLGFVNFYWKFIHDFSDITCPLYALTCKTQWWVWGSPEQEAFNALKKAVTSTPVLTFPSQSGCFCLECDASNFVTRAVLSQVQADGTHQPITFMSKGFSDVECNYQIHNKEMLAIMCALDEWHCRQDSTVRVCLRLGMCYVLVLAEL